MKHRIVLLLSFVLILAGSAFAQKHLEKPYTEWGKEDSLRIVNDSAWSKPYQGTIGASNAAVGQVSREMGQTVYSGGSNPRSVSRDYGPPPVTMRLHSGLTVRQALVRLQQLDAGYDKLDATQKTAFDADRKKFLDCAICKDYYVVTLIKSPDASGMTTEEGVFQGMTFDQLKGHIKLVNDKGEEREIVQFNAPKHSRDQAVFYFKRVDTAGTPLLTTDSKSLKFVFDSEILEPVRNRFAYLLPRTLEFKVSKIVVGGKVDF